MAASLSLPALVLLLGAGAVLGALALAVLLLLGRHARGRLLRLAVLLVRR